MIKSFAGSPTEQFYLSGKSRTIRATLHSVAKRKLFQLEYARELSDLASPPGNRLKALKGGPKGQYSIRINDQYRLCLEFRNDQMTDERKTKSPKKKQRMWTLHPGEILREEYLRPLGLTPYRLARDLHVPVPRINDIVLEKRAISADTAVRLAKFFGTSEAFWLGMQADYDAQQVKKSLQKELSKISPLRPPTVTAA